MRNAKPAYDNATAGNHDIAPGGLATIYNLSPLGKGVETVSVKQETT